MVLPLHVTPLRATEGKDAVLGEDIETEGINAFLVDNNKVLFLLVRVDGLVANEVLELDDLPALGVGEPTF